MAKDAKGHGSDKRGGGAGVPEHMTGMNNVGRGDFRLQSHTHEIVAPNGDVAARMRLGKNSGFAVDMKGVGGIHSSGGTAIHDAVGMADYRAKGGSFPSDHISTELHYLTGNSFPGHTVRRIK